MTGPAHYREAEDLLGIAARYETELCPVSDPDHNAGLFAIANLRSAAQVHATLALAGATALAGAIVTDEDEWAKAVRP
jgi:hypothetical protein